MLRAYNLTQQISDLLRARQGSFHSGNQEKPSTGGRSASSAPQSHLGRANPAGRPKGSRNKLSDAFLQALADDFEAHGKGVVEKVRTERPQDYLKIIASVMPKRMEVEDVGPPCRAADLSDDELAAIIAGAKLTVV